MPRRLLFILCLCLFAGVSSAIIIHHPHFNLREAESIAKDVTIEKTCKNGGVELKTDASGTYQWLKDDVDISGATSRTYMVTVSGNYKLKVDELVSDAISINLTPPTVSFTHNAVNDACGSQTVNFTSNATNADKYEWDFGDGEKSTAQNPTHIFKANFGGGTQTFTVRLKVTSEDCKETTSTEQNILVKQLPSVSVEDTDAFYPFSNCHKNPSKDNPNYVLNVKNTSLGASYIMTYTIDWGDGSPIQSVSNNASFQLSHTYTQLGAFQLKITGFGNNGCSDTKTYTVANQSNPAGGLGTLGNTAGLCAPAMIPFVISNWQNNSPGTKYYLHYGDGSIDEFSHPLNQTGEDFIVNHTYTRSACPERTFIAKLVVKNACDETPFTAGNIQINTGPIADFAPSSKNICLGNSIKFTDKTVKGSFTNCSNTTIYSWDFGDGNSSSQESPTHTYSASGAYTVKLTTSNPCGTTEKIETICVNPKPVANFTLPTNISCGPYTLKPTNTSNVPNCGANKYEWRITTTTADCDNVPVFTTLTSTVENPSFNLTQPGRYSVTLTTSNGTDTGCSVTSSAQVIEIKAPPTAQINLASGSVCMGATVSPTATVKNCYSTVAATYLWEATGAQVSNATSANPSIMFTQGGTQKITLKVTNDCGTNVYERNITVTQAPVVNDITDITVCNGTVVPITNFYSTTGGGVTYTWTNSNTALGLMQASGSLRLPSFTARNNGTTPITSTVTVTPSLGDCAGTAKTFTITVNPAIAPADAGPNQNLCNVTSTTLNGSAAPLGGKWTVKPGSTSGLVITDDTAPNTTITGLQGGGVYELIWTVTGYQPCGNTSSSVKIVVSAPSVGGSTSPNTINYCGLASNGTITLSGHTGNVLRWERSANETNWITVIPNNTTNSLNYTGLTATTYFRAVVQNGACATAVSTVSKVEIVPKPAPPTVTANYNYCLNTTAAVLTATGTGLKWYSNLPLIASNLLASAPTPVTTSAGTQTYYVTQSADGCESEAAAITVRVAAALTNTNIGASQTICANTQPATLLGIGAVSGGLGNYQYRWEISTDGTNFTTIASANQSSYKPSILTVDTWYRRIVSSANCEAKSDAIKITVQGELNNNTITNELNICYNTVPGTIIGSLPRGATGSYTYQWQESSSVNGPYVNINGATEINYVPTTALTETKIFRRLVTSGTCMSVSNLATVYVQFPVVLNAIADKVICNGINTNAITIASDNELYPINYSWINDEPSTGLAASGTGDVPEFTASNTTQKPLTATITYTGNYAWDGASCDIPSKSFKLTVLPRVSINSALTTLILCNGQTQTAISLTTTADSFPGATVRYKWTSDKAIGLADGEGIQLPSFTAVNQTNDAVTATVTVVPVYHYGGNSCDGEPVNFDVVVNPTPKVQFSVANQIICTGESTTAVNLSSETPGVNFSWSAANITGLSGLANSGTNEIPAQTLLNHTNAPITVIYKAIATLSGGTACQGNEVEYRITVNPTPTVTPSASLKTICSSNSVGVSLSSDVLNTQYKWSVSANTQVTGASNGVGASINQVLVNNSTTPQKVTYTVTPYFENQNIRCTGIPVDIEVTVNPSPTVAFDLTDQEICSGASVASVNLTSTTPNANITWTAAVPAGITGVTALSGTNNIPATTLINTTNLPLVVVYKAVASTNDSESCAGVAAEFKVTVNPQVKLTNTVLRQSVCTGAPSALVNLVSNVAAANISWTAVASSADVSGFETSGTNVIPVQTLNNSGTSVQKITYTILVQAYNCDALTVIYEIEVNPAPIFTSSLNKSEICSGKPFIYLPRSSTTGVTFNWSRAVVDGISNAAANGSGIDHLGGINEVLVNTTLSPIDVVYQYRMMIDGCLSGTVYNVVVTVNPVPTAMFGIEKQIGCAPFNLVVKNLNSRTYPNTYTVDFGDGSPVQIFADQQDIRHTYQNETNQPIKYYMVIKTSNECGEVTSIPYEIEVQPQTVFSKLILQASDRFGCAPFKVDFTNLNQSTGANQFTWDFGDGSAVRQTRTVSDPIAHTFQNAGIYTVTLTATNGCSTVQSQQQVEVYPPLNTSFDINTTQTCVGQELSFTNRGDVQLTSYWDFGDGTTSTLTHPKHTYTSAGVKTVTLLATMVYPNGKSCTAVFTKNVNILNVPSADFSVNAQNTNCTPFIVSVKALDVSATNVEWDFGDMTNANNIKTGLNAEFTYTKPGDYLITAKVYNAQGCFKIHTKNIRITKSPLAKFNASLNQICGTSGQVQFTNTSTYGGSDAVSFKWFVNDVFISSARDFNHQFNVPQNASLPYQFKVKLEATNMVGCKSIQVENIQFNPFPIASFDVVNSKGCAPFRPVITNNSTYADSFEWYLDHQLISTERVPSGLLLEDFGRTFELKLIAKNAFGCTESTYKNDLSTYAYLKADFILAADVTCNGILNIDVTNTSIGANSYTWDFGDGSPQFNGFKPTYTYGSPGTYLLKLTVSNGFCEEIMTKTVVVSTTPKANFITDVKSGCNLLMVKFTNTSVNATDYTWDFGDGNFSKEKNPTHQYTYSKDAYHVKLTVKNEAGCTDEITYNSLISVLPPPVASIAITPNKIIKVPDYSFNFKAISAENIISYRWDFGDGSFSDRPEVLHKYDRFGEYKVKLYVTSADNCVNVVEDKVTIIDFPGYLFVPNAFEPENLNKDLKVFKVKAGGLATYHLKVFNKWGQLIWETNKVDVDGVPTVHWDGTQNGVTLPQGAYFWNAEATYINGGVWKGMKYNHEAESKTGVIHLIR